jgi:hypothetical protein
MKTMLLLLLATLIRGPADVESLTATSDAVVHASVERTTSAWGKGGGQIFTTVVLKAIETWKGQAQESYTVLVAGGDIDDLSQTVQGAAVFREGEEVVVFLRRRAGSVYSVEAMSLGKFAVEQKRAVRSRKGLDCAGCKPGESDDLGLDELRARVLRSAAK